MAPKAKTLSGEERVGFRQVWLYVCYCCSYGICQSKNPKLHLFTRMLVTTNRINRQVLCLWLLLSKNDLTISLWSLQVKMNAKLADKLEAEG